jgi:hypothetical protein
VIDFSFEHENPMIDSSMKLIHGIIFFEEREVEIIIEYQQQNRQTIKELLSCYHVAKETLEEEDPHNI